MANSVVPQLKKAKKKKKKRKGRKTRRNVRTHRKLQTARSTYVLALTCGHWQQQASIAVAASFF
jgi:hypothetical protein